jgi:hypothetical protein
MNEMNDRQFREMLKTAMAPMPDSELKHDLWPRMLRRLGDEPARAAWLDVLLLVLLAIWCVIFPSAIPGLLYNL